MVVRAPADRRFRRAHVRPARRRRPWIIRGSVLGGVIVLMVLATLTAYGAVRLASSSQALVVKDMTVNGNLRLSRGEIIALLDGIQGTNMLTLDLEHFRQRLMGSPWVADADIRRVLPSTIVVVIFEREPIGIGRFGNDLYLMDGRAAIIDTYGPPHADLDLPIIDGLAATGHNNEMLVDTARGILAVSLLQALTIRPDIAKQVSQIDVSDLRNAMVVFKGDSTAVRVGEQDFVRRLQAYLDLMPALRERIPNIDYVDLRFDGRIYVRPHKAVTQAQSELEDLSGS